MKIRTGDLSDVPGILALLDGAVAWLTSLGRTGQWGSAPHSTNPARVTHVEGYACDMLSRIAEIDGRMAGVCVLSQELPASVNPAPEPELYIRLLVTDRALKGSGIGAALTADAREEAARIGVGLLRVDCYAGDDGALVAQYERLGFSKAEPFLVEREGKPPWPGQVLEMHLS